MKLVRALVDRRDSLIPLASPATRDEQLEAAYGPLASRVAKGNGASSSQV